ncbi:MAG: Fe-S cluster assembly protein SufD [Prevotellaceae bacterium]|jgi:Fe-S cluster assembly protein SufD|nr:Fe-S cluster assembly protein SufD [Prevotellaceae bacterium]
MNEQTYISLYHSQANAIKQHAAQALNRLRDKALTCFEANGFPTKEDEAYRYSRLMDRLDFDYGFNINRLHFPVDSETFFRCHVSGIDAHVSFIINDQFQARTKQPFPLPSGVIMCSLHEASIRYADVLNSYLGKLSERTTDGFVAMNHLFAQDGYFLYVKKDTVSEQPLQVINILRSNVGLMAHVHNVIIIEAGAEVKLLVCDHAVDTVDFFANRLTEVFVAENAQFQYYTLENTHHRTHSLSRLFVRQEASSRTVFSAIGLNNGVTRNHIEIDLNAPASETWMGGALVSSGEQQTENYTVIRHNAPNCHSNELFKYILNGASHGIFTGRIVVAKDAQGTVAYQTNRNICLSDNTQVHAMPQLEIYADDVKCGHGATTGQLDEKALLYMRSRGIDIDEARLLLMMAFISEVVDRVELPSLRKSLHHLIEMRLRDRSIACSNCDTCD